MEDKFSIQFEKGLLVQTYKYRSGPLLSSMKEVERMVTDGYLKAVDQVFTQMETTRSSHMPQVPEKDEFDEII